MKLDQLITKYLVRFVTDHSPVSWLSDASTVAPYALLLPAPIQTAFQSEPASILMIQVFGSDQDEGCPSPTDHLHHSPVYLSNLPQAGDMPLVSAHVGLKPVAS